jgi:protein-tyrosine phosphatase
MIRLCFVCLGNICRSPTAEGVMLQLVKEAGLSDRIHIDSAGTCAHHIGETADPRSRRTARGRGYDLPSIARRAVAEDFQDFDYILAMDQSNFEDLEALHPGGETRAQLFLFRSFDADSPAGASVPDPYYGGPDGFEQVFDICEAACRGLLEHLVREHALDLWTRS